MAAIFSRMWGDPAEHIDEWIALRARVEKAEKERKERERIKKSRRIRKLTRLAMQRQLKGQK